MTSTAPIQIPMIFDVSANGIVYGEDISGDAITNFFRFSLTPSKAQSDNFIAAMKNILYSDPSDNAANDASGVFFYRSGNAWNAIGESIRSFFLDSVGIKHDGGSASEWYGGVDTYDTPGGTLTKRYGIPYGIKQTSNDASNSSSCWYSDKFIDGDGTQFHKILVRIASTHLMGHPFSQGFIQENTIANDLARSDLSGQIRTHFGLNNLSDVSNGAVVSDASGKQIAALQTIYEQLLRHNLSDMSGVDQSSNPLDSSGIDPSYGVACPLVFSYGNTVTFYVRPRLYLDIDQSGGIQNMSEAVGNALGISGSQFSGDTSGTKLQMFNQIFSTNNNATSPEGYKWLAGRGGETLNQWNTNLAFDGPVADQSGGAIAMFDAHVWRINVTLTS